MPKYVVRITEACWVEFYVTVEADNEEDAAEMARDGDATEPDYAEPEIGASVEGMDRDVQVVLEIKE